MPRWRITTVPSVYSFRTSHGVDHDLVIRSVLRVLLQRNHNYALPSPRRSASPTILRFAFRRHARRNSSWAGSIAEYGENRRTVLSGACHSTFAVSARSVWSCGLSLFPGSPNTVKPLASSRLRHVPPCDAPSFETTSLAPKTAAKLMHPALDPQKIRRPDRL
jgi:hypothetical protein